MFQKEKKNKLKGSSSLPLAMRNYVGDGIQKIIELFHEIWELAQNLNCF
jgi:hypothetical protein